jgi:hypothetical protein
VTARLKSRYAGFYQHMLVAEGTSVAFYERWCFTRAGNTEPMWIYAGDDHRVRQLNGRSNYAEKSGIRVISKPRDLNAAAIHAKKAISIEITD